MPERTELKTGKGGCLTPMILITVLLAMIGWKIYHGDTNGARIGLVGCGCHLAPSHQP